MSVQIFQSRPKTSLPQHRQRLHTSTELYPATSLATTLATTYYISFFPSQATASQTEVIFPAAAHQ